MDTARGHCRLDQMSSLPDVIFTVRDSGDTRQVHASDSIVRRPTTIRTELPAIAFGTSGVTAMSSSAQVPVGSASTGSSGLSSFFPLSFLGSLVSVTPGGGSKVGVGSAAACTAFPPSGEEEPSLPPTRTRAMPKTSRSAVPSTRSRRVQ